LLDCPNTLLTSSLISDSSTRNGGDARALAVPLGIDSIQAISSDRIPAPYRNQNFFELPDHVQDIYRAAIRVSKGPLPLPVMHRDDPVDTLSRMDVPQLSGSSFSFTFSEDEADSLPRPTLLPS
jgi:hypothetical protein